MRKFVLGCLWIPLSLLAETHKLVPQTYQRSFSAAPATLVRVQVDDSVVLRLPDAAGYNDKGEKIAEGPNPLAGPIYIEGVEAGDAVVVQVTRLKLIRDWGWSNARLGRFALLPDSANDPSPAKPGDVLPGRSDLLRWAIDTDRKVVSLKNPPARRFKLEFAAQPMLGCIGVAAPGGESPSSSTSGSWGGNLDYNAVAEGASVILPAYHAGGLLYLGDPHALQADGEPAGTGIETAMEVQVQFGLIKKHPLQKITGPRIETREQMIAIGSQPEFSSNLDRAFQMATDDMVHWLVDQWGAAPWEAHMMIAVNGRYDVVTAAGSLALRLPRSIVFQAPPSGQ